MKNELIGIKMPQSAETLHHNNSCNHKPKNKELGYLEWHEWAENKIKRGAKQTQCPKCKMWLFKCEK